MPFIQGILAYLHHVLFQGWSQQRSYDGRPFHMLLRQELSPTSVGCVGNEVAEQLQEGVRATLCGALISLAS